MQGHENLDHEGTNKIPSHSISWNFQVLCPKSITVYFAVLASVEQTNKGCTISLRDVVFRLSVQLHASTYPRPRAVRLAPQGQSGPDGSDPQLGLGLSLFPHRYSQPAGYGGRNNGLLSGTTTGTGKLPPGNLLRLPQNRRPLAPSVHFEQSAFFHGGIRPPEELAKLVFILADAFSIDQ